ncbi:MAG: hypothetical protein JWR19_2805 [Pedosphaera sp.]|nr:hypothetical protein [Pedosphaera sp.]
MTTPKHASTLVSLALAIAIGLFAGVVDFKNNEPQAAVLVLLVLGGMLGFARPRPAWGCALLMGLGIPLVHLIAHTLGYRPVNPPQPNPWASLMALIPAFIGVYCGLGISKAHWLINKNGVES